ncbi:acetyltransferase [Planococcus kocurii]|uniref:Acetyltransferase n=1 Tax=Planococcus kocurii TaxID=1374 RepID=A0ABN4JU10_9BACL|nr:GNAT family N-acetyltransferase [Planococcus kocurii]ALS78484.1 acetyltransferase [Planococcus kocurii]
MTIALEKKYISLANYFSMATKPTFTLHLTEIEKIMGQNLPNSAYLNQSWWKKTKAPSKYFHAWLDNGYIVKEFKPNRYVSFERLDLLTKNGGNQDHADEDVLLIRAAGHNDARFLAELQKNIEGESDFLLYGKEERALSTQKVRKQIIEWNQRSHSIIFLAILNGKHVGYLMVIGNEAKRANHRAALLLGIQADAQGKGIAFSLLQKAEEWAISKAISRLELTVLEENIPARKLFEKIGYKPEGIRKNSIIINNKLHNEIYMVKFLDY